MTNWNGPDYPECSTGVVGFILNRWKLIGPRVTIVTWDEGAKWRHFHTQTIRKNLARKEANNLLYAKIDWLDNKRLTDENNNAKGLFII